MNKTHYTVLASALVAVLSFSNLAEARRAGGGKSMGMSRQSQPVQQRAPQQQQPQQQQMQQQQAAPQPAAPARQGPGVGSMVAAGAVGAVAGSMAANAMADKDATDTAQATDAPVVDQAQTQAPAIGSEPEQKPNFLMWLFLAGIAFFAFRSFGKKKA